MRIQFYMPPDSIWFEKPIYLPYSLSKLAGKSSEIIMKWLSASLILLLLGLSTAASGQSQTIERTFKGKPDTNINVGIFTSFHRNCTPAPLPIVRLIAPPEHGKVTVKQAHLRATNLKQCLGVELPAFVAFYRSAHDYIGQDVFTLGVIGTNGKAQFQRITVTILKPGSGQGI